MKTSQVLSIIDYKNPELMKLLDMYTNRMLSQLRQNFSKLNSINKNEIEKLFYYSGVRSDDLEEILKEYPGGGFVLSDPLYTLLTILVIKYSIELDDKRSELVSLLLSLIMLARLKFKYLRYCDPEIIDMAFNVMSKKTYIATHGIVWAVYKISNDTLNKYIKDLVKNPDNVYTRYRYIIDIRNKFNQFTKYITRTYFWVIANKDNIFTKDKIDMITEEMIDYISTSELSYEIIKLISDFSNSTEDEVYEFIHMIQLDNFISSHIRNLLSLLYDKLIKLKKITLEQKVDIDYFSLDFVKKFYNNSKKSVVILKMINDDIFKKNNVAPMLVLAFCCILCCGWEKLSYTSTNNIKIDSTNDFRNYE